METLETMYVYTQKELNKRINETIEKIKLWVSVMDYRIVGNIDNYKNTDLPVYNISKTQLKKINKYINSLNKKMTMRNVNSFLHIFYKTFEPIEKVQIRKSEKENYDL
jgi:hypothetical protein